VLISARKALASLNRVDKRSVKQNLFLFTVILLTLDPQSIRAQERVSVVFPFTRIPLSIQEDGVYELQAETGISGTFALVFRNKDGSFTPVEESYGSQAAFRFFFAQGDSPSLFFQPDNDIQGESLIYSLGPAGEVPRLIPELEEIIQQELNRPLPTSYPFAQGLDLNYIPEMKVFALWGKELRFVGLDGEESSLSPPPFPQDPSMTLELFMGAYDVGTQALMALAFYPPVEELPGELKGRVLLEGKWKVLPMPDLLPGNNPNVQWADGGERGPFLALSTELSPQGQWRLYRHQNLGEWVVYPLLPRSRDIRISRWGIWKGEPWVLGVIEERWHLFRWEEGFWRDLRIPPAPLSPG
jgi:hypothetical protein